MTPKINRFICAFPSSSLTPRGSNGTYKAVSFVVFRGLSCRLQRILRWPRATVPLSGEPLIRSGLGHRDAVG